MTTFKQFIMELADRKIDFEVIRSYSYEFGATAAIGKRRIMFSATYISGYWNVAFYEEWYDEEDDAWQETYDATGSGNEFEVLSLIVTCMKELLKRNDPDEIRFSASKDDGKSKTRSTIYRKIADRVLKGYTREEDDDGGPEIHFRYTKDSK